MSRTNNKEGNIELKDSIAFELFSSDAFLTVNKRLLEKCGPEAAIYISNMVDKLRYFQKVKMYKSTWFFLIHADQCKNTGMSEKTLRRHKKYFMELNILESKMIGNPAKEWYKINLQKLVEHISEGDSPTQNDTTSPAEMGTSSPTQNNTTSPAVLGRALYINIKNINNNKENKEIYLSRPDFKDESEYVPIKKDSKLPIEKQVLPPVKIKNLQYVPLAEKLSTIIKSKKNITHTKIQIDQWSNDIRRLAEDNKITIDRINTALDWYENNIGGSYVPVIESGSSLKEKFGKLEAAIERDNNPYQTKNNGRMKMEATSHNIRSDDVVYNNITGKYTYN